MDKSTGFFQKTNAQQVSYVEMEIFKNEINSYVKRKETLSANIQQAYSLVLGQCTQLMLNKLKCKENWDLIDSNQNVIDLLKEIKSITYNFEEQKYLPLSIHNAKASFYSFRQLSLSNADYLQKFRNLADVACAIGGNLHDNTLVEMVSQDNYNKSFQDLVDSEKLKAQEMAKENTWLWHCCNMQIEKYMQS